MSRSSEDVLLIVNKVKNKKCEGSIYMMSTRMAWMPSGKDTVTVSHNYADIRVQKISPDTKDKVQLQIVLHDGGANTFHFNNPHGKDAQRKDREQIKELLQQVLPRFRKKVNSELEEKNRMLQEDPELFQLYKDLVVSGVVTADEFWINRTGQKQSNSVGNQQEVGVSPGFLSDIKPQTDGCNGLSYNLTADIIESIFRTYPAVKQKHAEYVPDKVTEQEFWTKFFQSHYFHRDRVTSGSKDLFTDCAKTDEQDLKKEMSEPLTDPLVDLTCISDSTVGEGYGSQSGELVVSTNPSNSSLIRRFNQHSTMVLKACDRTPGTDDTQQQNGHDSVDAVTAPNGIVNLLHQKRSHDSRKEQGGKDPPPNKKVKIREKIQYEDLGDTKSDTVGPSLNLTRMDRYLHGPTPITATQYNTSEDSLQACQATSQEMMVWTPRLNQILPTQTAISVLWELSPGGALMQGHTQQQLHQLVQSEVQEELRHLYSAFCELLRHFWSCFPATSKFLEEKAVRMKGNLDRFHMAKLNTLKEKLRSYHYSMNLVGHMEELLDAAYTKFSTWQNKKFSKKS